jgi:hypothetical protein
LQPDTTSFSATENTVSLTCDGPLSPGRKLRCDDCVHAAEVAIREAAGQAVRPSDIDIERARARLGDG